MYNYFVYLCKKYSVRRETNTYNECCLYFTANSLARTINEMTDQAFAGLGISGSYGHLMLLIINEPNQNLSALTEQLNVKSSTMTRFIDKLEHKNLVRRHIKARTVTVTPTKKGIAMLPQIEEAFKKLYDNYCKILGEEFAVRLTADINQAHKNLSQ